MDEKSLCEFVERYNSAVEKDSVGKFIKSMRYAENIRIVHMLDDLMATHDANAPQWVEASAVASDGTRYWARVDAKEEEPFIGLEAAKKFAKFQAQTRAEYLANRRGGAE